MYIKASIHLSNKDVCKQGKTSNDQVVSRYQIQYYYHKIDLIQEPMTLTVCVCVIWPATDTDLTMIHFRC